MLSAIKITLFVLSIAILIAHQFLPDKTIDLLNANSEFSLYADKNQASDPTQIAWKGSDKRTFECIVKANLSERYCGLSIKFVKLRFGQSTEYMTLDLSQYKAFDIDIDFTGPSDKLTFYYRNALDSVNSVRNVNDIVKFQSIFTFLKKSEMENTISVDTQAFDIADWWLQENYVDQTQFLRNTDKIIELNIQPPNNPPPGIYTITVNSIKAKGPYIRTQQLYFYIMIVWLSLVLAEGLFRITMLYRQKKRYENSFLSLNREYQELESSALKDDLTGIYNRSGFNKALNARQQEFALGNGFVFVIDIDYFKLINDNHGHDVGDSVLKTIGERIGGQIRAEDIFCRWGGEEFVLVGRHDSSKSAFLFADKIRTLVCNSAVAEVNGEPLTITVSIGVSELPKIDQFDVAFKQADECLYKAKKRGRNRVVIPSKS
jgi:diguanylate cyclase (GGDEF)-like protein